MAARVDGGRQPPAEFVGHFDKFEPGLRQERRYLLDRKRAIVGVQEVVDEVGFVRVIGVVMLAGRDDVEDLYYQQQQAINYNLSLVNSLSFVKKLCEPAMEKLQAFKF